MNFTFQHQVLTEPEIAALTPTVLYDSPRGGYRLLWGTWISRPKRQSGWLRWKRPRSRRPNAVFPGGGLYGRQFSCISFSVASAVSIPAEWLLPPRPPPRRERCANEFQALEKTCRFTMKTARTGIEKWQSIVADGKFRQRDRRR